MSFKDQNCLITGATSGIGYAVAEQLVSHNARVTITGRREQKLSSALDKLKSASGCICDTSDLASIDSLYKHFEKTPIDVLVINAAVAKPLPFELVDEANFDLTMNTNFKGAFFTIQKAIPFMNSNSKVVVVTSIANQMGSPNFSAYAASKAALRSLVKTLGLELISKGIRVNALSPGPIQTEMYDKFDLGQEMVSTIKDTISDKSPIGRFGSVEEAAKAVLFLSSDDSSYIVGDEIVLDGGMSLL